MLQRFIVANARRKLSSTAAAMTGEKEAFLDIDYFMGLAERPGSSTKKPQTSMTPEKWPSISISSVVYPEYECPSTLKLNRDAPVKAIVEDFGNEPVINFENFDNDNKFMPVVGEEKKIGKENTFQSFIKNHFARDARKDEASSDASIANLRSLLRKVNGAITISPSATSMRSHLKYTSYVKDIKFIGLEKRTLTDVLGKTLGYDEVAMVSENWAEMVFGKSAITENVEDLNTTVVTDDVGSRQMLVIFGDDLHLLEYHQLVSLAKLFEIETKDSRNSMERALCKKMKEFNEDSNIEVEQVNILTNKGDPFKSFSKTTLKEDCSKVFEYWTDELDADLISRTEKVRDARRYIVEKVDQYLSHAKVKVETQLSQEDLSLWEVVATWFPGCTPKACRKRWHVLHRMICMETKELG